MNLVLQQVSDITSANWVTLTNKPTVNLTNLHCEMMVPIGPGNRFYRLATP